MSDEKKYTTPKDSHYARLRRAHRDSTGKSGQQRRSRPSHPATLPPEGLVRLYGLHTVRAALDNPKRKIRSMFITRNAVQRLGITDLSALPFTVEVVEPKAIDLLTGTDAVHQGVVVEATPLRAKSLSTLSNAALVLVLDQVTDPHNVGAIMRSAVAFGVDALITTTRHSPEESGVLAKAASGALEHLNYIEVRNLATAIEELHDENFFTVGLDSDGPEILEETLQGGKIALVLGSEGKGLRQKTRDTVRALARLDMTGEIRSLNVSNATAVALYVARKSLA